MQVLLRIKKEGIERNLNLGMWRNKICHDCLWKGRRTGRKRKRV